MDYFFRVLYFSLVVICSISINSFSGDGIEKLGNELNIIKERITFVDQEITGKLIARNDIITNAKEIIIKELNKENEKVKSLIKIENRNKEDFFNVVPQKTFNEVSNLINKQYEDNWKLHEGEYKAKILEEFPLLKPGMRTSIKTKRGVFEGYLRKIHPSCIQINNKTIYFIDLEDDEIARLDKTRYQAFVDKELLKAKKRHEKDKEQLIYENMLKEGYLPLSDVNFKFAFTESVNANWCTRAEIVSHFMKKAEYDILTQIKNDYCLKNYAIGYVEMKKKVNNINNQINQIIAERENEQREIELAKRRQAYHNSTSRSGGLVCADCGGRGKETVWNGILRKYIDIRCRSCGGSGNAGYAGDYLENGRRVRSQMDQDLGRMMGVGGGGGIFGN